MVSIYKQNKVGTICRATDPGPSPIFDKDGGQTGSGRNRCQMYRHESERILHVAWPSIVGGHARLCTKRSGKAPEVGASCELLAGCKEHSKARHAKTPDRKIIASEVERVLPK